MRLIHRFTLPLTAIFAFSGGCSLQDDSIGLKTDEQKISGLNTSPQLLAIRNYMENRFTRVHSPESILTPIIEDGDTLMYLAQYSNGWELFSNSFSAPMVLMKSEAGEFENTLILNPDFAALFYSLKSGLKVERKSYGNEPYVKDSEWQLYNACFNPTAATNDVEEEGIYTQVGSKSFPIDHRIVNHLINTHWHQNEPCNIYMPFNKYNSSKHIYVGCTPVATGQFLYYTHYKWGTPTVTPSAAIYDSSNNKYIFSGSSTEEWDKMGWYPSIYDTSTPLFLGWIAKEIKATPKYSGNENTGTGASISEAAKFIAREARIPCECISYDVNTVTNLILNEKPVILWLNRSDGGHTVIIDDIDYTEQNWDEYYAYVTPSSGGTDPTKPIGPDTGTTDDYDYLVKKYGRIYTEHYFSKSIFFKFNWGWGYGSDDVSVNGKILTVTSNDTTNYNYRFHQIINYSLNN